MSLKPVFLFLVFFSMTSFSKTPRPGFYYLTVTSAQAEINCFINGFPVYHVVSRSSVSNQVPVNLALAGKDNRLTIRVVPLNGTAVVDGGISLYKEGEVVSTDDDREEIMHFAFRAEEPADRSFAFDNETFDFTATLRDTPVITGEEELKEYAVNLRGLFRKRNLKALRIEMEPKVADHARAFSVSQAAVQESMEQFFRDTFFKKPLPAIAPADVAAIPYCEGRIWALRMKDGSALIRTRDEDGDISLPVYVAMVNGALRVVR